MEKEKIFSKEEIIFLNQLIKSLEETELKLEEYYEKEDVDNFNGAKKMILNIQKKISEVVE